MDTENTLLSPNRPKPQPLTTEEATRIMEGLKDGTLVLLPDFSLCGNLYGMSVCPARQPETEG
ncbi:MAG TPA: hypothetical protein VN519_06850 [Bryobacteraceae bacterium]|nr:hypothetical protein [Bryobacteraceae bacterium]